VKALDGLTLFNLVMITLVELGAVFWVGAQLWFVFVLQPATEDHKEESTINRRVQERFERHFSLPVLLVLLFASIGVLVGQALNINAAVLSPAVVASLATNGRFGTFWMMREIVIGVVLLLSLYMLFVKQRPRFVDKMLAWGNLILGLALLIAISMSSQAAALSKNIVIYAIPIDWLHLLAAALWVGGLMTIATTYLPIIGRGSIAERTRSLLTTLPYYTPWVFGGVALLAVTGLFSATFRFGSMDQLITTAYGRALIVKTLLVCALLLISAIDFFLLRPRLKKEYRKYTYAAGRLASNQADQSKTESDHALKSIAQQVKLREGRLSRDTRRLTQILIWEPLLGVAVLICVGLMNVFAGTLTPTAAQQQQTTAKARPYSTTVKTTDNRFTIDFNVNPNRFGTNVFTASVIDNKTGKPTTNVGISLFTTMLDMYMGTDSVKLLPDGKGHFSASGDLSMGGNWQIRIQIRTPDGTLHEASVKFYVPF
jgi:copper transport protein